jgi:ADP-heptose:LPS heptosyltransferase
MSWLFRDHFGADIIYEAPKRPGYFQLYQLYKNIGYTDLLVHFGRHLKLKDLFFLWLIKANHIAGLDDEISLVDMKLGSLTKNFHFREKFRVLVTQLGVTSPDMSYIIPSVPAYEANVESFWPKNKSILSFNPYGSGGSRRLNQKSIEKILTFLKIEFPEIICCFLYAPNDKNEVKKIAKKYPSTVIFYENSTHICDVIAQMRRSLAVLSVDTATVHIANGLSKPLFALYNDEQENFIEWGPVGKSDHSIFANKSYPPDINNIPWIKFKKEFKEWWKNLNPL